MNTKIAWSVLFAANLVLGGCGSPDADGQTGPVTPNDDSADSGDPIDETEGATGANDGPVATDDGPGPEPDPDGSGFITDPDGGGPSFECDIFAQDCPQGEKCMPWANDGGSAWNATRCSPVAENPGQAGDDCTVEGSGVSGLDDCDLGAMCWDVDPETNVGNCIAMCTGDETNPICDDPDTECAIINDGALVLCLPPCDPLLQDCVEGQACYPIEGVFQCTPDASGEMGGYADPCEFINACDPGLVCLGAAATPDCMGSAGCCSEVCDTAVPDPDAQCSGQVGGQTCQSFYEEGAAPPGYENVGVCALPG